MRTKTSCRDILVLPQTARLQGHENNFEAHAQNRVAQTPGTRCASTTTSHLLDNSDNCNAVHHCYANTSTGDTNVVLTLHTSTYLPTTSAPAQIYSC